MSVRRLLAVLAAAALPIAAAAPAEAATLRAFHTPGNGIRCFLEKGDDGSWFARCDSAKAWKTPPKPKSCLFDYGQSVNMAGRGHSRLGCVSDAVPEGGVLARGKTTRLGRVFTCTNGRNGVRCTNRDGHGWTVSTRAYRLF